MRLHSVLENSRGEKKYVVKDISDNNLVTLDEAKDFLGHQDSKTPKVLKNFLLQMPLPPLNGYMK